jgi:hypothetical protein
MAGMVLRLSLLALAGIGLAAGALRLLDHRADAEAMRALADQPPALARFDPEPHLAGLPEPARRFFGWTLETGAPLTTAVRIEMGGTLALRPGAPQQMTAVQLLAPPRGLVWQVRTGAVSGADAILDDRSWSRFRVAGAVPVARAGGTRDHLRSSFGRMVGEGLFWTPAAFLPAAGAGWDALEWTADGPDRATVTVRRGDLTQDATVHADATGQPLRVTFPRWSDANPEAVFRPQPFGGELSDFTTVAGQRLPFSVTGGNHYGTPNYDAFFHAEVTRIVPLP